MAMRWTATPGAGPDARGDPRAQHGRPASRTSGEPSRSTAPRRRTSSTPTSTATSATSSPATCRSARTPTTAATRPVRGDDGSGEWTGRIPYDDLPWQFDPRGRRDRHGQQRRGRCGLPAFRRPRNGTRASAPSASSTRSALYGDDGLTVEEMGQIQYDDSPLAPRDVIPLLEEATPATDDGADDRDAGSATGTAPATGAASAARPTTRGSTGSSATSSTTTWARSPATTSAARSRGCCCASSSTIRTRRGGTTAGPRASPRPPTRSWPGRWTRPALSCGPPSAAPTAGRGARCTPRPSARRRWARAGSGRSSGTSTRDRARCPGPPAPSTTPTSSSRRAYPDPTDPDYVPVGIDHVFDMTNMPSYRLTIDMRDLDGARLIITTGQSGNPFDRHYNDQIEAVDRG